MYPGAAPAGSGANAAARAQGAHIARKTVTPLRNVKP